ncbi:MAG: hypothetical protein GX102_06965 [Porphyromonadaceae bacterium]|jgi:hypothetical protein|nr:hypothetical protein [Porphyromonadaceae bacterium]
MEGKKSTNEINLVDILGIIWKWIVAAITYVVKLIGKTLQLLFRYKVLTIILLLLSFAFSQYQSRSSNRKFKVGGMAILHGVPASTIKQVGRQLTSSSDRFEATSLGQKLGLDKEKAESVELIEFFDVIDYQKDSIPDVVDFNRNHSLSDTTNVIMPNYIYIQMKMKGTKNVDEVGDAVLEYLNENATIKSNFETKRANLTQRIEIIDAELKRIDSLSLIKYFKPEKQSLKFENNQLIVGNQFTQLFYGDKLTLQKNKAETLTEFNAAKSPVIMPSGFIINPKALNGRVINGIKGLLIGLAISIFFAFIIENYRKWIEFLNK